MEIVVLAVVARCGLLGEVGPREAGAGGSGGGRVVATRRGLGGWGGGVEPGWKVWRMIMRPPQQGHGRESISGSSALASASGGSLGVGETGSSSRARAMFSARPPLA